MDMLLTKKILQEKAEGICKRCGLSSEIPKEGCDHCRMHIVLSEHRGNKYDVVLNGNTGEILSITAS